MTSKLSAEGWASLYNDHAPWLLRWIGGRCRAGKTESADLLHETFLRLLTSQRYPEPAQSRAFLVQIAKGLMIDLQRRERLETAYLRWLSQLPEPSMPSPELKLLTIERLSRLDAVLDELSARARTAFLLSRFEGLTYQEIASRLEVSVGSVRKYMLSATAACMMAMSD